MRKDFATEIPVNVPSTFSEIRSKPLDEFVHEDNIELFDFMDSWCRELHTSKRERKYINFVFSKVGIRRSGSLTVDLLRKIFVTSMDLATAQKPPFSNPVAAFELLAVADHHVKTARKIFPTLERDLKEEVDRIKGLQMMVLCMAVNYHFSEKKRLAGN
jgi:hypothetical protein